MCRGSFFCDRAFFLNEFIAIRLSFRYNTTIKRQQCALESNLTYLRILFVAETLYLMYEKSREQVI
jgi:hypothetical protein